MKIHLVKKSTIENFSAKHPQCREVFKEWLDKLNGADWEVPGDIRKTFVSADLLGNSSQRVVFDIGGGNYRM